MGSHQQFEMGFRTFTLPQIKYSEKFNDIGRIEHVIRDKLEVAPTSKREIQISQRRKEDIYQFEDQEFIITSYKSHPPFNGIDGIISSGYEKPRWLQNTSLEEFKSYIEQDNGLDLREKISNSWTNQVQYLEEIRDEDGKTVQSGLRKPQLGALHAIISHWTISNDPATIVMPTGTGKTETMLSTLIAEGCQCVLVVVPSVSLRNQTKNKFVNLGILKEIGILKEETRYPIVGTLEKRPKETDDLKIFDKCNVLVTTIHSIAQGTAVDYLDEIREKCSHLILDEAHHVPAPTWSRLKEKFEGKPILQFTATPFREDQSPIKGKVVYDYPLAKAQEDGLFKSIDFHGVFETDPEKADREIAEKAVAILKADLQNGLDHILMARCKSKKRGREVFDLYNSLASELNPVLIHSTVSNIDDKIEALVSGNNKVVVTVDMLQEGFDLPELKIAAMHDKFKSLAITLQFIGRFTRDAQSIGKAKFIANTGLEDVYYSLQNLYDEDSDWDKLIAELSFEKIEEEKQLLKFLNNAERIDPEDDYEQISLSPQSLKPKYSTVVYRTNYFNPNSFYKVISSDITIEGAWINSNPKMLFFVIRYSQDLFWCNNKNVRDINWDIFALYYEPELNLLFIHSTADSNNQYLELANAVTNDRATPINGERVFKVFGGVKRLMLNQVGLLNVGPRNMRYSMFTGKDIKRALSEVEKSKSKKSNLFGHGFENGEPASIGCSQKGKIWKRGNDPLLVWAEWCKSIGEKLNDDSINVDDLIENVLKPVEVKTLPEKEIFFIDWPDRLYQGIEDKITVITETGDEYHFSELELRLETIVDETHLQFNIVGNNFDAKYELELDDSLDYGYKIKNLHQTELELKIWTNSYLLSQYLTDYPPLIFYLDQSELHGNIFTEFKATSDEFPESQLLVKNWNDIDIRTESMYASDGSYQKDSIQESVMSQCRDENFDLIFDDDGPNEIADVVAIKEDDEEIVLRMLHCKYSSSDTPGARVDDIIGVASQATKNVKWFWNFNRLLSRLITRENTKPSNRPTRFYHGNAKTLKYFKRLQSIKGKIKREVILVQPGVSKDKVSENMTSILGSTDEFHKTTLETPVLLWCSE